MQLYKVLFFLALLLNGAIFIEATPSGRSSNAFALLKRRETERPSRGNCEQDVVAMKQLWLKGYKKELEEQFTTWNEPEVLRGHSNCPVYSVAVAPNGDIVSGSHDGTVRVWNSGTGECKQKLMHGDYVRSVAVATNGDIVSGSDDRTVRVWNSGTGECKQEMGGCGCFVSSVAVASNGDIVSASDEMLRVWDLRTGGYCKQKLRHSCFVFSVAVASNGDIVSGSDEILRVWDSRTGVCKQELKHSSRNSSVAVAPNGDIVSASVKMARVWDSRAGKCKQELRLDDYIESIAVAPNGDIIFGLYDGTVRVLDVRYFSGDITSRSLACLHEAEKKIGAYREKQVEFWIALDNL